MSVIDSIQISGTIYTLSAQTSGGNNVVELTQAEYDALVTGGTVDPTAFYIITDAQPTDISQYWTSAQTQSAITQAVSGKQDTLSAGTGIDITNNVISVTGGSSGGKAIEGGHGITVTTGATADTVSIDLPISGGSGTNSLIVGHYSTSSSGNMGFAGGYRVSTQNYAEFGYGQYNTSRKASTSFGVSGNTLFTIGNGDSTSARHNAFEIRENGDIYIPDTNSSGTYYQKPMIKLQDKFTEINNTIGDIETLLAAI